MSRSEKRGTPQSRTSSEIVRQTQIYSSPLPIASEFQGYEAAVEGAGHRILGMAERQQEHRIQQESRAQEHHEKLEKRGLWIGSALQLLFILLVFTLLGGLAYLGYLLLQDGKDTAGYVALSTAIVGILVGLYKTLKS